MCVGDFVTLETHARVSVRTLHIYYDFYSTHIVLCPGAVWYTGKPETLPLGRFIFRATLCIFYE